MYTVTLRRVRVTTAAVEKQLRIVSVAVIIGRKRTYCKGKCKSFSSCY